jgi:hypothetical protein
MNVQRRIDGRRTLRRQLHCAIGESAESTHLRRGQQVSIVGPPFGAVWPADTDKTSPHSKDLHAIAVIHGRNDLGSYREFAAQFEVQWPNKRLANRGLSFRPLLAAGGEQNGDNKENGRTKSHPDILRASSLV